MMAKRAACRALLGMAILAGCGSAQAQQRWNGAGGDDLWSNAGNWTNGTAPANPYNGTLIFGNEDAGNTHALDQNWVVRSLTYSNGLPNRAAHTTDLGGNTLTISNGYLAAGYLNGQNTNHPVGTWLSNTVATITNGTLQLGTPGAVANLYAGFAENGYTRISGTVFRIAATVNATNLNNLYVGFQSYINYGYRVYDELLDLRGAVVSSRGEADALILAGTLNVGNGPYLYNGYGRGALLLPPELRKLEAGNIIVGADGAGYDIYGKIDFGVGSQLRTVTATNAFRLGGSGSGLLAHFPTGVTLTVGRPDAPGSLRVGAGVPFDQAGNRTVLALSNGTLTAWLNDLRVGSALAYNYGRPSSNQLDLSTATVQIGDVPNSIRTPILTVAGYIRGWTVGNSANMHGELNLPGTITNLEAGLLELGANYTGRGILDFGTNSQLKRFAVTNDFLLSYDGGYGIIKGFPTQAWELAIGRSNAPCHLWICSATNFRSYYNTGVLAPTNATVSAWLKTLEIGSGFYYGIYDWGTDGTLDLTASTLVDFNVTSHVWIGSAPLATGATTLTDKRIKGRLLLPAGHATIGGDLRVGETNSSAYSLGVLTLNGTTVDVSGRVQVNNSGSVTTRLAGVSAGINVQSTDTNNLVVANNGVICLVFDSDPVASGDDYFGLRIQGDQTAYLKELAGAGHITWVTNTLAPQFRSRFGIHYNTKKNYSYVGLAPLAIPGVLIQIQ